MVGGMGIFKKEDPKLQKLAKNVLVSFSNLKQDMEHQRQLLHQLHSSHETLTTHHHEHKQSVESQVHHMQRWIQYLHSLQQTQHAQLTNLEHSFRLAIASYNNHITDLYKKFADVSAIDTGALKKELLRELTSPQPAEQPMQPSPVQFQPSQRLSNPEQKLLSLLFNEDHPLTYEQLVQKTGKNINTLRVTMNNLKKNSLIEENQLPNGLKVFAVANKEKIKKMYNVAVL